MADDFDPVALYRMFVSKGYLWPAVGLVAEMVNRTVNAEVRADEGKEIETAQRRCREMLMQMIDDQDGQETDNWLSYFVPLASVPFDNPFLKKAFKRASSQHAKIHGIEDELAGE